MEQTRQSSIAVPRRLPGLALQKLVPYILIAPAFLVLGLVLIYPMMQNIYLSTWEFRFTNPEAAEFVGFDNYVKLLTRDPLFWQVLRFTLIFTGITIALEFVLGLVSALLLFSLNRIRQITTSLMILPYMIAPIAVGLTWRLLWTSEFGLVNYMLGLIGLDGPVWLVEDPAVLFAVVIPETWRSTPFVTLILLAGLVSQPFEVFEAARVDGASRLQTFWYITLPLLIPSAAVALLFQTIFKLRVFDLIYILTNGGPGTKTLPLGILVYRTYFRYLDGGYAAAIAVLLLLMGLTISIFYIQLLYRKSEF